MNIEIPNWPVFEDDEREAVDRVLASGKANYWTGEEGQLFEKEFANWCGSRHGLCVFNGTIALEIALRASGIRSGDEVIVTPRSFLASAASVVAVGAIPVFADVDFDSGNLSAQTIEREVTDRTRGIVTMGANNSWSVYRPNLWTCVDSPGRFIDTGWKDPGILKFVPMSCWNGRLRIQKLNGTMKPSAFRVKQMPSVFLYRRGEHFDHKKFLDEDTICWGNNSATKDSLGIKGKRSVMLVALRLLHYLGFRTVYLVGADFKMDDDNKYAFDESRTNTAIRHNNVLYESLNQRFEAMRDYFKRSQFNVINCTPNPRKCGLTAFEFMPFEEAIQKASAECSKQVNTKGWYA